MAMEAGDIAASDVAAKEASDETTAKTEPASTPTTSPSSITLNTGKGIPNPGTFFLCNGFATVSLFTSGDLQTVFMGVWNQQTKGLQPTVMKVLGVYILVNVMWGLSMINEEWHEFTNVTLLLLLVVWGINHGGTLGTVLSKVTPGSTPPKTGA